MKIIMLASILILTLLITGCTPLTVDELNNNPSEYLGKKVTVTGKVTIPLQIAQISGFTLRGEDSSIMVSSDAVPEPKSEVTVRGTLVKGLFSQQNYIYADSVE